MSVFPPALAHQVDYYRDPMRVNTSDYQKYSEIAQWNNEGENVNQVRSCCGDASVCSLRRVAVCQ